MRIHSNQRCLSSSVHQEAEGLRVVVLADMAQEQANGVSQHKVLPCF
jgi:hypothetical protein